MNDEKHIFIFICVFEHLDFKVKLNFNSFLKNTHDILCIYDFFALFLHDKAL